MPALFQPRLSARNTFRILFRFKLQAGVVFAGTLCSAFLALCLAPRTYVSEAQMLVKTAPASLALDSTATTDQPQPASGESRDREICSLIDVLKSRVIHERVVDQVGAAKILNGGWKRPDSRGLMTGLTQVSSSRRLADSVSSREKAIEILRNSTDIESSKKETVVTVRGKAGSPALAQQLTAAYVAAYVELQVRTDRTADSDEKSAEQAEQRRRQLTVATRELRDMKNRVGVVSIEGRRSILEQLASNLERELAETDAELQGSRDKLATLAPAQPISRQITGSENADGLDGLAIDDLREQLYALQTRQRELSAMVNPSHPRIAVLADRVKAAERVLNEKQTKIELAHLGSLQARAASLQNQHATAQQQLRSLADGEARIRELEQQVELLQENYETSARKHGVTRMHVRLEQQQGPDVALIQPASFVEQPIGPRKLPILLFGLIAALLGSIGTAFACECLDGSLKTPEEVEQQLEVPVLLSIPQLPHRQPLMN